MWLCHWDWRGGVPQGVSCVCAVGICWGTRRFGCVWCRCAVGIGGGGVALGVFGIVLPWGLVGGVFSRVGLGCIVSCRVVLCRVELSRVVVGRVVSWRVILCR